VHEYHKRWLLNQQQENGGLTAGRGLIKGPAIAESAKIVQRSFRLNKRSQDQD
jgi:hypothetical protein